MKIKELRRMISQKWEDLGIEKRVQVKVLFWKITTYLFNAILLSIPFTLLIHFIFELNLFQFYISSVIGLWILIPFAEHYYIWLRVTWKDELGEEEDMD